MADGFEPFHVPQQSRRDKLRVFVRENSSCEAAATTLQGCSSLVPFYDPSLLPSGFLATAAIQDFHHPNHQLGGGKTADACKQSSVCAVKEEGMNLMGFVGGFMNASSSSSSSHHPYLDPHSSLTVNPASVHGISDTTTTTIADTNNNPFLYTAQNLRDFEQSFHGGEVALFKPEPLPLTHDSTSTGQGLSLSLSSHHTSQHNLPLELNLQRYDSTVFDQKNIGGIVFRGAVDCTGGSTLNDAARNSFPLGPFTGYASILMGSRFLKPAQQLLQEFCDVSRAIYAGRSCEDSHLMDPSMESVGGIRTADNPLTCGDRGDKKTRLITMLDEVYRKYKQYYQQMENVVASFESVAGLANAAPYISLAFKAMSKHFGSLKNALTDQIQSTSKTHSNGNFRNDESPMFGTTDRNFHSQRQIHGSGFLEHQPVWRPQRGLPERAVAVLRAWLFEHFLHPYPTDSDKQMLARQTGLSRSQVSNWFINARVRLWKPMVEEIHMLETRQTQKATEARDQSANESIDHQHSANTFHCDKQPQNTSSQTSQASSSKRSRNSVVYVPEKNDEPMNFSYGNLSSDQHVGVGMSSAGGSNTVSLTLGLRQNNGIGISESFPLNMVHRFGLEGTSDAYVMGGF